MNDLKYNEFLETLSFYGLDVNLMTNKQLDEIFADALFCIDNNKLSDFSEYFKYDFLHKSNEERQTFCGSNEYGNWCRNSIQNTDDKKLSKNKYLTYLRAKSYYKRDLIKVSSFDDYKQFSDFVEVHKDYIVKSIDGSQGANISKVTVTNKDSVKALFFQALQYGGCVCEEWIKQSNVMAAFNDSSVNTVRVTTMYDDGKLKKIYGMFRTGIKDMPVDNASMGGIASGVDLDTGIVFSNGYTKKNKMYTKHPNSGKKFKGFQLPNWDEAMQLINKLHETFPEFKIMGWDLAFTDSGWILVEINSKPSIDTIQLICDRTYGHGLRNVLEQSIGKYK